MLDLLTHNFLEHGLFPPEIPFSSCVLDYHKAFTKASVRVLVLMAILQGVDIF